MSRDFDPETDQFPDSGDQPSDVERPADPAPVPPDQLPQEPVREPPDAPNVPDDPNPDPIGDPERPEPLRVL